MSEEQNIPNQQDAPHSAETVTETSGENFNPLPTEQPAAEKLPQEDYNPVQPVEPPKVDGNQIILDKIAELQAQLNSKPETIIPTQQNNPEPNLPPQDERLSRDEVQKLLQAELQKQQQQQLEQYKTQQAIQDTNNFLVSNFNKMLDKVKDKTGIEMSEDPQYTVQYDLLESKLELIKQRALAQVNRSYLTPQEQQLVFNEYYKSISGLLPKGEKKIEPTSDLSPASNAGYEPPKTQEGEPDFSKMSFYDLIQLKNKTNK